MKRKSKKVVWRGYAIVRDGKIISTAKTKAILELHWSKATTTLNEKIVEIEVVEV